VGYVARLAKVIDLAEKIGVYLDITGLGFSLTRGFTLGEDLSLNYLLTARRT